MTKVDDTVLGDGKAGLITRKLLGAFHEFIQRGEDIAYSV